MNGRYMLEYNHIWEEANGNKPKGYAIHHKNGIKTDDRLENLELMVAEAHTALSFS